MKDFIKDTKLILTDPPPEDLQNGDEIELSIVQTRTELYSFSTFDLGIKDEFLSREKIYGSEQLGLLAHLCIEGAKVGDLTQHHLNFHNENGWAKPHTLDNSASIASDRKGRVA